MRNQYKNYTVKFQDGSVVNTRARTRNEAVSKVRKNNKTTATLKGVEVQ